MATDFFTFSYLFQLSVGYLGLIEAITIRLPPLACQAIFIGVEMLISSTMRACTAEEATFARIGLHRNPGRATLCALYRPRTGRVPLIDSELIPATAFTVMRLCDRPKIRAN